MIRDWTTADTYLGRKPDRPLDGRATRIQRRDDGSIAIKYQATDVVTYREDGTIVLDSASWRTVTTKQRINEYTPARVIQTNGVWYFAAPGSWSPASRFYDKVTIGSDGQPIAPLAIVDSTDAEVRKAIAKYCRAWKTTIEAGELADPSQGDCWGCLFHPTDEDPRHPTIDESNRITGIDHLVNHLREMYLVPSLAVRALAEAGYRDPGFIWTITKQQKDSGFIVRAVRKFYQRRIVAIVKAWPVDSAEDVA